MLLLGYENYVFDTVDETTEFCDEDSVKELISLGLVKQCMEHKPNHTELRFSDEYKKYADSAFAKGVLLNSFSNKKYSLDIEKDGNTYRLSRIQVNSDDVRVEIPFFVFLVDAELKQLNWTDDVSFIKIVKKNPMGYGYRGYINKDKGTFMLSGVKCNQVDLSELNLQLTYLKFIKSSIGNVILSDTLTSFDRLFTDCEIGVMDFNNIDFSKITSIANMFIRSNYDGNLDFRGLRCIKANDAFLNAEIRGDVLLGKLKSYSRIFNAATVHGTVSIRNIKFDNGVDDENFLDMFTFSVIDRLDLRGTTFPCLISMQFATIGELYVSDTDVVLKDTYTTKALTLTKLIFDNVTEVGDMKYGLYGGLYDIEELEEVHFMNCDLSIILKIVDYIYGDIISACGVPIRKIRIIQNSTIKGVRYKEEVKRFLKSKYIADLKDKTRDAYNVSVDDYLNMFIVI